MTLFMRHFGWTQLQEGRSWNPLKTFKSTQTGLRMIYDAHTEAFMQRKNRCILGIIFGIKCWNVMIMMWAFFLHEKRFVFAGKKVDGWELHPKIYTHIFLLEWKVGWQSRETAFFNLHEKCLTGRPLERPPAADIQERGLVLLLQSFWCMMLSCALFQRQCAKE